jgi:hypothetical protein
MGHLGCEHNLKMEYSPVETMTSQEAGCNDETRLVWAGGFANLHVCRHRSKNVTPRQTP